MGVASPAKCRRACFPSDIWLAYGEIQGCRCRRLKQVSGGHISRSYDSRETPVFGQSRRVTMRPVPGQRTPHLNRAVKINNKVVTNHGKTPFFVPFVNVGRADVLASPGCRTMYNNCVNCFHAWFHFLHRRNQCRFDPQLLVS